jgi:hypothetical protein
MARTLGDNDALSQFMRDSRAADTKRVSRLADAQELVQRFLRRSGAGAWPSLDRQAVGNRLGELIVNPRLFDQGALNLCGPATFLCMWAGRDPVGFARFATTLFEEGAAAIGSLEVAPTSALREQDYATMLARMKNDPAPQADWMTMGAIRNNEDALFVWTGDPKQDLPGLTLPQEVCAWLQATGIYSKVDNEANWATRAGWSHASNLLLFGGQDIALLLNTNALIGGTARALRNSNTPGSAPEPAPAENPVTLDDRFLLNQFPNHYVMLLNSPSTNYDPVDAANGSAFLSIWSWGQSLCYQVPARSFTDNYYGAVIALLP